VKGAEARIAAEPELAAASEPEPESYAGMEQLERLFARHMRARAMLREVVRAEREALTEIVWMLKAVPSQLRQEVVSVCVERAAAGLIQDPGS
jgi:hypothetical protein